LAKMIGEELDRAGFQTAVKPAREVKGLDGFDAVIIAGALYAFRWHRDARRFARRHAQTLRDRPVWLVSSGPLDGSAGEGEIPGSAHGWEPRGGRACHRSHPFTADPLTDNGTAPLAGHNVVTNVP
jgi:menaquinone-dependent protoporphyrinogen oxidase